MNIQSIELANLIIDFHQVIGFHSANGFDPAICTTEEGSAELIRFYDEAIDSDIIDLALYLSSLRELKGFKHSNEMCKHLNGVQSYPLIAEHLCLSVYS